MYKADIELDWLICCSHSSIPSASCSDNGYKLTYMGLDYLALRVFVNRGTIAGVGRRIGVGKESGLVPVFSASALVVFHHHCPILNRYLRMRQRTG